MKYFFQIFEDHFITGPFNFYLCILFSSYLSSATDLGNNSICKQVCVSPNGILNSVAEQI